MIKQFFIGNGENLTKKTYLWTILSGLVYSGSSYVMFLVCSQVLGATQAGVYSIAVSIGQQLVTIGYFNMRTFQVSDVREQFSFADYLTSRVFTSLIMLVVGILWIVWGGYGREKAAAIFLLLLFKIGESMADVFQGLYQQKDRYDISCRTVFYETLLFLAAFIIAAVVTRSLLPTLAALAATYLLSLVIIDGQLVRVFSSFRMRLNLEKQKKLLVACLPLFINSFLLMYINNAAKYAIDTYETADDLAKFNALFMVAYVITLFASFVLKPLITSLSLHYAEENYSAFFRIIWQQMLWIFLITVICEIGAYLLGVPVLSWISGLDLSGCRELLCLMLAGGALNAVYQVFQYTIIIMRKQYACLAGCIGAALVTLICVPRMVSSMGIWGGAAGYLLSMAVLSGIYFVMVVYYYKRRK